MKKGLIYRTKTDVRLWMPDLKEPMQVDDVNNVFNVLDPDAAVIVDAGLDSRDGGKQGVASIKIISGIRMTIGPDAVSFSEAVDNAFKGNEQARQTLIQAIGHGEDFSKRSTEEAG